MVRDPSRRRLALADRLIEVIDERQTGETLLDEALKMMKSSEKYGTGAWVDLMSGKYGSDSCDYIIYRSLLLSYQCLLPDCPCSDHHRLDYSLNTRCYAVLSVADNQAKHGM